MYQLAKFLPNNWSILLIVPVTPATFNVLNLSIYLWVGWGDWLYIKLQYCCCSTIFLFILIYETKTAIDFTQTWLFDQGCIAIFTSLDTPTDLLLDPYNHV